MIEGEVEVELDELSSFPEEERVFLRFMSTLIDKHKLDTPDFIKRHIRACGLRSGIRCRSGGSRALCGAAFEVSELVMAMIGLEVR